MKKYLAMLCTLVMALSLFSGCKEKTLFGDCEICRAVSVDLYETTLGGNTFLVCSDCKENAIWDTCNWCGFEGPCFEVTNDLEEITFPLCYDCKTDYNERIDGEEAAFDEDEELAYDEEYNGTYEDEHSPISGDAKKDRGKYIKPHVEKISNTEYKVQAGYYENDKSFQYADEYTLVVNYKAKPSYTWISDIEKEELPMACYLVVYRDELYGEKIGMGGASNDKLTGSFNLKIKLFPKESCKILMLTQNVTGQIECTGLGIK